ncbi:hypothetical protein [Microbispora tritici]|uniref:Uncharacterized protein n=1 Tax=Microbispora tritici TaxID=2604471 RepID=A0ABY3LQ65_9ACTN|nr:hypothetical protein [Microbispora tritici]TYB45927.1 hypothetical protein FXF59_31300 [Microbispora tritici]
MPTANQGQHLAFVAQVTPSKSRVFKVMDHGSGPVLEALVTFPREEVATSVAVELNGVLVGRYLSVKRVRRLLIDAPDSVRSSIEQLLPLLEQVRETEASAVALAEAILQQSGPAFASFPTAHCFSACPDCGEECATDCIDCYGCRHGECDNCFQPDMTPRTALALHTAAEIYADQAYEVAEELGHPSLAARAKVDTWPLLPAVAADQHFARRMARSFDDLANDLALGRLPLPSCTSEEIALWRIIDFARELAEDSDLGIDPEEIAQLPQSRFDYDWGWLTEVLYQDHDFLDLMSAEVTEEALNEIWRSEEWIEEYFETFGNVPGRDPRRGFRH